MNRTSIEWTDWTWNPIFGCPYKCIYCYGRNRVAPRLAWRCEKCGRYELHFHPERLGQPYKVKKPSKIFVGSCAEVFTILSPRDWVEQILKVVRENPQHTFQFLSKCPSGMASYRFPANAWCGTSVATQDWFDKRAEKLMGVGVSIHFLSAEPLHSAIDISTINGIDWIIIGAETGQRKGRIEPESEWIEHLTQQADSHNIPVFHKDNLAPYYKGELRREYPRV